MPESISTQDAAAIEQWAHDYLVRLSDGGRRGVLMGGSIARGEQWLHSDLEAGVLAGDAASTALPYFNVDSGRGVEIIQLNPVELHGQVEAVEGGDLASVATWPIQLYKARVISDPSRLLQRFVAQFDAHLFQPEVVRIKVSGHKTAALGAIQKAKALAAAGRPRAGLSLLRYAMNEAILAFHWQWGELPRSQNRTDSRLRKLAERVGDMAFHQLYRQVFGLDGAGKAIATDWPLVRQQVLDITELVGGRRFFETAVDSTFSWGEDAGILTVYRLYVPLAGMQTGSADGIFGKVDDAEWAARHPHLLCFLGLDGGDSTDGLPDSLESAMRRFS